LIRLHLLLDRLQNRVWKNYNSKRNGKNKPNIYFPITDSEEKFGERLQKDQLHELAKKNPALHGLILRIQPFQSPDNKWLSDMYHLTSNRHENDVELTSRTDHGIGFGKGQNLHIRHMSLSNGSIFIDSQASNQKTGQVEGLKIDLITSEKMILDDLGVEALPFSNLCLQRTRAFLNFAFKAMSP